jgi:NarL family two-component system response regulator LiaR
MSESRELRLLIVDDFMPLRQNLAALLNIYDELQVVGTAANGQEALARCEEVQPDVILMDVAMPVLDGLTATKLIRKKYPHVQVIILTSTLFPNQEQIAFDAGACTVLDKTAVTIDTIAEAVKTAS